MFLHHLCFHLPAAASILYNAGCLYQEDPDVAASRPSHTPCASKTTGRKTRVLRNWGACCTFSREHLVRVYLLFGTVNNTRREKITKGEDEQQASSWAHE